MSVTSHDPNTTPAASTSQPLAPVTGDQAENAEIDTASVLTGLLTQACPGLAKPSWLPEAATAIAAWHDRRVTALAAQLSTLRRSVRDRVLRAVADGDIAEYGANDALRGWGMDPLVRGELERYLDAQ
jgi:hypothetical protein